MKNSKMFLPHLMCAILFFAFTFPLMSQSPGGVKNPVIWKNTWNNSSQEEQGFERFNFHPYQFFNEDRGYEQVALPEVKKLSLFVVFSSEQNADIATINTGGTEVLITDSTLVSRRSIDYESTANKPKFISYIESFPYTGYNGEQPNFLIGSKFIEDDWYEGGISEVILYDRLISKDQRLKVESYLSLKYGISLPLDSDYLRSDGKVIRSASLYPMFNYNVTAIGKDIEGGLDQKQSHNLYSDIDLTVGLNELYLQNQDNVSKLKNHSYLIWADNDGAAVFEKVKDPNNIQSISKRAWEFTTIGDDMNEIPMMVKLDPTDLANYNTEMGIWIARFLSFEDYEANDVDSYSAMSRNEDGTYQLSMLMDEDNSGSDFLNFVQAPDLFAKVSLDSLDCDEEKGSMHVSVHGVDAQSISLSLHKDDKQVDQSPRLEASKWSYEGLSYGVYNLQVLNELQEITQKVYLTKSHCLNLSGEMVDNLYPNPVGTNNEFVLSLDEVQDSKIEIAIYNSQGQLVKKNEYDVEGSLVILERIKIPGSYTITAKGKLTDQTYKLVVQ